MILFGKKSCTVKAAGGHPDNVLNGVIKAQTMRRVLSPNHAAYNGCSDHNRTPTTCLMEAVYMVV